MMRSNAALLAKAVFADLLGSFLYFPIWWYSSGLVYAGRACFGLPSGVARSLGLSVWLRNLFVPMYGQRDFFGRFISVMMRFIVIIFDAILFLAVSILAVLFFAVWLVSPVAVVYGFIQHAPAFLL